MGIFIPPQALLALPNTFNANQSLAAGFSLFAYNTADQTTHYERGAFGYAGNRLIIGHRKGGSGSDRALDIYGQTVSFKNDTVGTIWEMAETVFRSSGDITADLGATATRMKNIFVGGYQELSEMTAPSAPAANKVRLYSDDSGGGKTRIMALFPSGAAVQLGIEP